MKLVAAAAVAPQLPVPPETSLVGKSVTFTTYDEFALYHHPITAEHAAIANALRKAMKNTVFIKPLCSS